MCMDEKRDGPGGESEPNDRKDEFKIRRARDIHQSCNRAQIEWPRRHSSHLKIWASAKVSFAHRGDTLRRTRRRAEKLILPFYWHVSEEQGEASPSGKHLIGAGGRFAEDFAEPIRD